MGRGRPRGLEHRRGRRTRHARRARTRSGCRFVAVASAAGTYGLFHLAGYTAVKHAVVGLVKGLAADLVATGVTAVAVSPGLDQHRRCSTRPRTCTASRTRSIFSNNQLLRRVLDPDEVAATIAFCCSVDGRGAQRQRRARRRRLPAVTAPRRGLPLGFRVRVGADVRVHDGGRTLVGGSPLRVLRLKEPAPALARGAGPRGRSTGPPRIVAERLLAANLAAPVLAAGGRRRGPHRRRADPRPRRPARPAAGRAGRPPGDRGRRRLARPGGGGRGRRAARRPAARADRQRRTRRAPATPGLARGAHAVRRVRRLRRRRRRRQPARPRRPLRRPAGRGGRTAGAGRGAQRRAAPVRALGRRRALARPRRRCPRWCGRGRRSAGCRAPACVVRVADLEAGAFDDGSPGRRGRRPRLAADQVGSARPLRPGVRRRATTAAAPGRPGWAARRSTAPAAPGWPSGTATGWPPRCCRPCRPSARSRCSPSGAGRCRWRWAASRWCGSGSAGRCRTPRTAAGWPPRSPPRSPSRPCARARTCCCGTGGRVRRSPRSGPAGPVGPSRRRWSGTCSTTARCRRPGRRRRSSRGGLDDLAYGAGLWWGAVRARSARVLVPRITGLATVLGLARGQRPAA